MTHGTVSETYHAALAHDLVTLPDDATRVGVVRRPTRWFLGAVDENHAELGPPETLLDEFQHRREDFEMRGMCSEGAHNAAWEECDFGARYREYLDGSTDAAARLSTLVERIEAGERVVLVCFEGDDKRCHRHALVDEMRNRIGSDA